jgi:hypothetical protein
VEGKHATGSFPRNAYPVVAVRMKYDHTYPIQGIGTRNANRRSRSYDDGDYVLRNLFPDQVGAAPLLYMRPDTVYDTNY